MTSGTGAEYLAPPQREKQPETQQQQSGGLQSWRLAVVIASLCLGIFLLGLDNNIISVAIPSITTDFHALDDLEWYGSAFLLTVTAFQPLFGSLYKYFNAKAVYLVSLFIFEVGSTICAAAPKSAVLIFGRALLGFGAAGLLQGALAIIGYVVRLDQVPLFQGVVVSSLGISVCLGPILGGVLTQYASWRWCFWINVPAGVVVIISIFFFVKIPQSANQVNKGLPLSDKLQHMDAPGTTLFLGAICCLLLVLQWGGQTYPWNDGRCIALFVLFGVATATFCFVQSKRGELAIIPLRILRMRSILMGSLSLFSLGMSSLVYAYYLPLYFQSIQGLSASQSGVRFIALVLPQIVGLVVVGAIVSAWGYYVPYMIVGSVITSTGAGLLTTIDATTPTVKWAAYMVINGLGIGMAQQLPYTALQVVLDQIDVPIGNAIAVFSYQLGGALGIGIGQNLLLNKLKTAVPQYTNAVTPEQVIAVGATGLTSLAPTPEVLHGLRLAYADSIRYTLILALVAACLSFPFSCAMERLNVKHVAEERARPQGETQRDDIEARSSAVEGKKVGENIIAEG